MSSRKIETDLDDSVICLDLTSVEGTSDDDESFSVSDFVSFVSPSSETTKNHEKEDECFVSFDKTLPPGVAPEGFIILDESNDVARPEKEENVTHTRDKEKELEKPMFKVLFRDEDVARQYKKRVRDFLLTLVPAESRNDGSEASKLVLEVWNKKSNRKRSCDHLDDRNSDDETSSKAETDKLLFTIDKKPLLQDRLDVPTYGKKFDKIMETSSGEAKPENDEKAAAARPKMNCWNCMGNHTIRDCSQPRNPMEISKNRTIFQSKMGPRSTRYHVDDEQKYGHFVPGQISKNLKRALGIRDNELPRHIYRMRMLGYPPGWLKEARLQHSGMNLYDSNGLRELDPMEEIGQIIELGDKDQYDVNKIHDFPGFNVPPPSGTREEEKMYWKSDHYFMHSKESMLAMLSEKKVDGYKRKKLKRSAETNNSNAGPETVSNISMEMDVVEDAEEELSINGTFVPPLPKTCARPPLPSEPEEGAIDSPKPGNLDLESAASPSYIDSPTLADLESRKKQLLDELEDSNSVHSAPSTPVITRSCSAISNVSTSDQPELASSVAERAMEDATLQSQRTMTALITPSHGAVKSVALGTPILESTSPYNKLPSVDKFSKDICDIINFENLPDSTGKYEQMTGILQKVRSTLAFIQQD